MYRRKLFFAFIPCAIICHFAQADGQVSVNSINLIFKGCEDWKKRAISDGWEDAVSIAKGLSSINWNEAAALEFLGPPLWTQPHRTHVQGVFDNAATFSQGSIGTPSWFKWNAYVRCDDWLGKCKKNPSASAYTENRMGGPDGNRPKSDSERASSTMIINYCDRYFTAKRLIDKIAENQGEATYIKYNLDWYRDNTAYITLHEFMHADVITYVKNGNRHIDDWKFNIKGSNYLKYAYGAANTKLFAQIGDTQPGDWVSRNADNFAQYALAKTVQKRLGNYPHLPHTLPEQLSPGKKPRTLTIIVDGQIQWAANMAGKIFGASDANTTVYIADTCEALDGTICDPPDKELDSLISDSFYPTEYTVQRNQWYNDFEDIDLPELKDDSEPSPLPEDLSLQCKRDPIWFETQPSVEQSFAQSNIENVCYLFKGILLNGVTQQQLIMPYPVPNNNDNKVMWLWAAWNLGDSACTVGRIVDVEECKFQLSTVLNGCDTSSVQFKYGGTKVNNCIVWGITVSEGTSAPA